MPPTEFACVQCSQEMIMERRDMTGKSEALYPRFTRCLFLCLILTMPAVMESSGASSVEHFQRFVSGEQPIKNATIYRSIEGPDERIINEDWLRFAYETET